VTDRDRLLQKRPDAASQYDELVDDLCSAMRDAGIDERRIYATRKTGLMPSDSNEHLLTVDDWREWDEALEEYDRANVKSRRK
jgi:hypothetical protein